MRRFLPILLLPTLATASPWTLKRGELVVVARYDTAFADEEFLVDSSDARRFPLAGELRASTYALGARIGVTDWFEIQAEIPVKQIAYSADPVILLPAGEATGDAAFDFYQENVLDFSQSRSGIGDIELAARFRLFTGAFAGAAELHVRTPTGYDKPSGTFGDKPRSKEAFLADPGRFVAPENVEDDVTLGDATLDVAPSILLGWATRFGMFTRLDAGYRLRVGGASDQVIGGLRIGQLLGKRLLLYAGASIEYSLFEGDVVGISVIAIDPDRDAADFGGLDNLDLREVTLDRDRLTVPAGLIFRLTREVELNASYTPVVWGRNTARSHGVSVGVGIRTQLAE